MEPLDYYAESARRLSSVDFSRKLPHLFLLKRPRAGTMASGPITFRTQALSTTQDGLINDAGPFADGYWVWPLKKRPENPFPERVSMGRAPNCDVVFRLSYVSKLHAHVMLGAGGPRIVDQGSANGTRVNGMPLKPQVERPLVSGSKLELGAIELTVLDAAGFYDMLRREILPNE